MKLLDLSRTCDIFNCFFLNFYLFVWKVAYGLLLLVEGVEDITHRKSV